MRPDAAFQFSLVIPKAMLRQVELQLPRAYIFLGEGKNFQLLGILNISKWEMSSFLPHYKFSSGLPSLHCVFKRCSWEAFKHANRETWLSSLSIRAGALQLEEKLALHYLIRLMDLLQSTLVFQTKRYN